MLYVAQLPTSGAKSSQVQRLLLVQEEYRPTCLTPAMAVFLTRLRSFRSRLVPRKLLRQQLRRIAPAHLNHRVTQRSRTLAVRRLVNRLLRRQVRRTAPTQQNRRATQGNRTPAVRRLVKHLLNLRRNHPPRRRPRHNPRVRERRVRDRKARVERLGFTSLRRAKTTLRACWRTVRSIETAAGASLSFVQRTIQMSIYSFSWLLQLWAGFL